jgi:hypothetical protein
MNLDSSTIALLAQQQEQINELTLMICSLVTSLREHDKKLYLRYRAAMKRLTRGALGTAASARLRGLQEVTAQVRD